MFEVAFLGTSAAVPSIHRGLSSHIVMHRQYRFLVDCGEGTQRQILRSGLGFKRLNTILLTHGHLDHILGLGGIVSTLTRWETEAIDHIDIHGGKTTLDRVQMLINGVVRPSRQSGVKISYKPLLPAVENSTIVEDDKFRLGAFPVSHRGPDCFGFLFEEKERRPFLPEKAAELNIPAGPERAQLVRGNPVTLPDGRTITPEMVLGEMIPGTKYVHIGDVGKWRPLVDICRGADALTIEATYIDEEAEMARQVGHLTAAQSAQLAVEAGVKTLILTHLSRRYFERDVLNEAREIFPNTYVARDFDLFQITRDGTRRLNLLKN